MTNFCDQIVKQSCVKFCSLINKLWQAGDISLLEHGFGRYTSRIKIEGLKQSLDASGNDLIFGCVRRDVKGGYAKASESKIANFTDTPYAVPDCLEVLLDTMERQPEACVEQVINAKKVDVSA